LSNSPSFLFFVKIRNLRVQAAQDWLNVASQAVSSISNLIEAQKQKELSAVGQNAAARERIEKEYYKKQKAWAISQAIINGALAVTNLIANVPGSVINPATWAGIAIAGAATLAEIAVIASQSFAKGGLVYGETLARVGEYPGAHANPEVIAPLTDLKKFLQPNMAVAVPNEIELKVKGGGRNLYAVLKYEQMIENTF
jgi:hypothetical protein